MRLSRFEVLLASAIAALVLGGLAAGIAIAGTDPGKMVSVSGYAISDMGEDGVAP